MSEEILNKVRQEIANHATLNKDNELCIKDKQAFAYKVYDIFSENDATFIQKLIDVLANPNPL